MGRWPLNLENDRNVDFIAKTLLEWKYSLRAIKVKYRYCLYLMRRKITLTNNPYHKLNNHKERKLIWGRTKYIHIFLYFFSSALLFPWTRTILDWNHHLGLGLCHFGFPRGTTHHHHFYGQAAIVGTHVDQPPSLNLSSQLNSNQTTPIYPYGISTLKLYLNHTW